MAFPTSPTNGQTAVIDGISYVYSTTTNSWTRNVTTLALSSNVNTFTGDGVNNTFTLSTTPASIYYTIVMVGGVWQPHTAYTIASNTITFSSIPTNGVIIEVVVLGTSGGQLYTATSLGNLTLSPFLLMGA